MTERVGGVRVRVGSSLANVGDDVMRRNGDPKVDTPLPGIVIAENVMRRVVMRV